MTTKNDIEQLFRGNYATLLGLACRILGDEEQARDIVHDVFATLLTADVSEITTGYLVRAVRNRCLTFIRNATVRDRLHELYLSEQSAIELADQWPDEAMLSRLNEVIDNDLSAQCRRVVDMRFRDGLSYRDIATALGIGESAVYKHLRHALDVLRLNLNRNEQE